MCVTRGLVLCLQGSSTPGSHWPVRVAGRRQRPGRRALHRHRGHARLSDGVLAAGVCWKERARSHRRSCGESEDPAGPVAAQALHCLSRTGMSNLTPGFLTSRVAPCLPGAATSPLHPSPAGPLHAEHQFKRRRPSVPAELLPGRQRAASLTALE